MRRVTKQVGLLAVVWPLLQFAGCALFDGGLVERTLTGAIFMPFTEQVFETFFDLATGG